MEPIICHEKDCERHARVALHTQRPTRDDLWTKIFWDNRDPKVPKKSLHYCNEHGLKVLHDLYKVLVHEDDQPEPERVQVTATCYGGLKHGDKGTVVEALEGEAVVRFDRDGSERLISRTNLASA